MKKRPIVLATGSDLVEDLWARLGAWKEGTEGLKSRSCRTNCVIALWRKENMERLQGSVACFWKTEAGH